MKKTLALILAALMLASAALVSCSNEKPEDDTSEAETTVPAETTTAEETTTVDPRTVDELPTDVKYDGYEFTILSHKYPESSIAWMVEDIYTEAENGERINDAVYKRNLQMNERYGVIVKQDLPNNAPDGILKKAVQAGEDTYALIQTVSQRQANLVMGGFLARMDTQKYLNFDKVWWDTTAIDGFKISGKVHFAPGSGQLNNYKSTWGVFFNKKMAKDANLPDLYQAVKNNEWTLDHLKTYGKMMAKDVNGDGKMEWGIDTFGVGIQNEIVYPLVLPTGARVAVFKDDGTFEFTLGDEKFMNAIEQVWTFINVDNDYILNATNSTLKDKWVQFRALFMSDQIGFYMGHLGTVTLVGSEMKSDFGILPFPKLDAKQEYYVSDQQYANNMSVAIPKSTQNFDRTAFVTEAYQMLSHSTVREAYYDYTLTFRSARDNESGEMLDIIFARRNLDATFAYNGTTKLYSVVSAAMKDETFKFASTLASQRESMIANIQKVLDTVKNLDD